MKINAVTKIFAYTMLLLVLMCMAAGALFFRQFLSFYRAEQHRILTASFQPILNAISDKERSPEEIAELARGFANNNQSFRFIIREGDGKVLFSTYNAADLLEDNFDMGLRLRFTSLPRNPGGAPGGNTYIFNGYGSTPGGVDYGNLIQRSLLALLLMLLIAVLGAVLFAKKVTKPLEDEIIRERAMEENQRLFFSAASHELKTPIAAAKALVEGMIAGVGDYTDHPKYLRECLKTLDAQGRLVSEILEIVKFSDADAETAIVAMDLTELGNQVLAEYRPLAEQHDLSIQGEFPCLSVHANRNLLHRVISNVMANAVQNTPSGGMIRIEAEENKHLRLSILNTGAQIPEEVISRLFEPFYRLDTARTRRDTQSGLGLAIVKKALDRMKFPFAIENTSEGVLFWVDLPVSANFRKTSGKVQ